MWGHRARIAVLLAQILWPCTPALAADLEGLKSLFTDNYNTFYEPRYCGRNIMRLVAAAQDRQIDLSGAYVLKIEGAGFLETSGFYTRGVPHERAALGYFHFVMVADGHVFDFDLHEPLVLGIEDYVRLQFTPAKEPAMIFGIQYRAREQLKWWTVTRIEIDDLTRPAANGASKAMKLGEYVDLEAVMALDRCRLALGPASV